MSGTQDDDRRWTEAGVREDLQRQPHLMIKLAENSLRVAENLRENYFRNTTTFIRHLRRRLQGAAPLLTVHRVDGTSWEELRGEVATFIDGGIGSVELATQLPILLRVGSYCVRTGERQMAERERFGYYPVILGDLTGGSKERKDFPDIVRITAELLGGLSALERTTDLRVLMFHGPLVYLMSGYAGHTPFTEKDIDLFLSHYGAGNQRGVELKERFLDEARRTIYPRLTERASEWVERRLFEPLSWIAYLYRQLISLAKRRVPTPIIAGVVERTDHREFGEKVLLQRIFEGLRAKGHEDYFNKMFGRTDLTSPKNLIDKLGYSDSLLLGMLLRPEECSETWEMTGKYDQLRAAQVSLPGEGFREAIQFDALKDSTIGFPPVLGQYVHISNTTEPIRVEVFKDLGGAQPLEAARRVYLYSRLLPRYGFPLGLDIADKYAKVPAWMTDAYAKLIKHHLGVSLQRGEISDAEMRRILVQAIYMTHRDWLFRPKV